MNVRKVIHIVLVFLVGSFLVLATFIGLIFCCGRPFGDRGPSVVVTNSTTEDIVVSAILIEWERENGKVLFTLAPGQKERETISLGWPDTIIIVAKDLKGNTVYYQTVPFEEWKPYDNFPITITPSN
jgi:hypothetical protein